MSRNSVLGSISSFNKSSLKPTTTVVRNTVITDNANITGAKDDVTEYIDAPQEIKTKVKALADLIRNAKHFVAYTGAGISTSAKIPDYRGPEGAWTLRAQGRARTSPSIELEAAIPTYAHMALVALANKGLLKHVVSTNLDGLHMRSGLDEKHLSELHGNCYKEKCDKCGKTYLRSFDVSKEPRLDHLTGRSCDDKKCDGQLRDSIINFGENLPVTEFSKALEHSKTADLALVLGTSMIVRPACELPSYSYNKNKGNMVICNKQKTPYDSYASSLIHADLDDIFVLLMEELGIEVSSSTPEGLDVSKPKLELEEKFAKSQNNGEQNFLSSVLKTHRVEVTNKSDTTSSISNTRPNTFVYIAKNNDSQFSIPHKAGKVVIDQCKDCTITLESGLTTGTLEVINCQNVAIKILEYIPTITVDLTTSCELLFESVQCFKDIVTAKCSNLSILIKKKEEYKVPTDIETVNKEEWEVNQYITRRNDKSELFTEKIIRVGGGYVSTERENAEATEKERINELKLQRFLRSLVSH